MHLRLKEVQIEYGVLPVTPLSLVAPLRRSHIGLVHQLRNVIDVLAVFDQRADERSPGAVRCDSFIFAYLSRPFANNIPEGRVAKLLFNFATVGVFGGLKKKIIFFDFPADHFHPGDVLINILRGGRMNRNLILHLPFPNVAKKPNSFLHF